MAQMTRKEFLQLCSLFGIGLPLQTGAAACEKMEAATPNTIDKVIIVGAGIAGLSAGYLLHQQGIDVQILEATNNYGGRVITNTDFADFPIPLGAEWLHVQKKVLADIVNDPTITISVDTAPYQKNDQSGYWSNNELTLSELGAFSDLKFVNGGWLDFYETYILPPISKNMVYHAAVEMIEYSADRVTVHTSNQTYEADKVIVTIPLKMLQKGMITFSPALPVTKQEAIREAIVWDGIKVFIEFTEQFYPTFLEFAVNPTNSGERLYYDAAYGQQTTKNILGLFSVGTPSHHYTSLPEDELLPFILSELDTIFDGQATPHYIKHLVQDWTKAPFFEGAYLNDYENEQRVQTLFEPIDNKVFFAGEAYTSGNDWGGAHAAAEAAKEAVEKILK